MSQDPIQNLTALMSRLPGVGEKSASRMVFALLAKPQEYAYNLADALRHLVDRIRLCSRCSNLTEADPCLICDNKDRDQGLICVVETVPDLIAVERTQSFDGVYHVLHGALAPMDGITPEQLKIRELLQRLESDDIREIIIATNPTIEGDSTALYLNKLLAPHNPKVTRIASGIPMGGDLEYIDRHTLSHALQQRRELL